MPFSAEGECFRRGREGQVPPALRVCEGLQLGSRCGASWGPVVGPAGAGEGDHHSRSLGVAAGQTQNKTDVHRALTTSRDLPGSQSTRRFRRKGVTNTPDAAAWGGRQVVPRKALSWECALSLRNDLGAINFR